MQMNYFSKLPLKLRLAVVLSFLIASIAVGILGRPSRTLVLASVLLLLSGGWRISRTRSFVLVLILVPALVGLLLTHFDWRHPFLSRYLAGLFSVIAVLLLLDGVRVEEWIEIVGGKEETIPLSGVRPLLIGAAVGTISMSSNIREQRTCRRLANIRSWGAKSRASIFLDSVALPFYNAVESHEFIDEALRRWGAHDGRRPPGTVSEIMVPSDLTFANSNFTARLSDVNDFPAYRDFIGAVLSAVPMAEPWAKVISELTQPAQILEIGDPTGRFAKHLLEKGFQATVPENQHAFRPTLDRLPGSGSRRRALDGVFPGTSVHDLDHIFFHHTSFLEAVNQAGLRDLLERLSDVVPTAGRICFDYPAAITRASQGVIFSGAIDDVGKVEYRYVQHEQHNDTHKARLEYTVSQGPEVWCVRAPLSFIAPGLPEVLAAGRQLGFSCSTSPIPGDVCFPSEGMVFVELQKQ
jgi:hypothetical protein